MWEQEVQGIKKFDDLEIVEYKLPVIKKLESALVNSKPKNTVLIVIRSYTSLKNGRKNR